jgi:hypothetical protein
MTALDLTVVREPSRFPGDTGVGPAEDGTAAFADALSALAGREVPLFEGFVRDAPADGLLVIRPTADFERLTAEMGAAAAAALAARAVLIGETRMEMAATLERFSIAAGIDEHRFWQWASSQGPDRGRGLFGLKAVAAAMPGATLAPGPRMETERYGYIVGDRADGLPAELVAYVRAYAARPDARR